VRLFHGDTEGDPRLSIECFSETAATAAAGEPREIVWVFEKEREGVPAFQEKEKRTIAETLLRDYEALVRMPPEQVADAGAVDRRERLVVVVALQVTTDLLPHIGPRRAP
jgi:hypothetical protein